MLHGCLPCRTLPWPILLFMRCLVLLFCYACSGAHRYMYRVACIAEGDWIFVRAVHHMLMVAILYC